MNVLGKIRINDQEGTGKLCSRGMGDPLPHNAYITWRGCICVCALAGEERALASKRPQEVSQSEFKKLQSGGGNMIT